MRCLRGIRGIFIETMSVLTIIIFWYHKRFFSFERFFLKTCCEHYFQMFNPEKRVVSVEFMMHDPTIWEGNSSNSAVFKRI